MDHPDRGKGLAVKIGGERYVGFTLINHAQVEENAIKPDSDDLR